MNVFNRMTGAVGAVAQALGPKVDNSNAKGRAKNGMSTDIYYKIAIHTLLSHSVTIVMSEDSNNYTQQYNILIILILNNFVSNMLYTIPPFLTVSHILGICC